VLTDAFTASGDEIPILGLAVINSSPTILGSSTTFTVSIQAGTNVTYSWDFGDGGYAAGANAAHTYAQIGFYTATITATNSLGSVFTQIFVTILDVPIAGLQIENDSPTTLGDATTLTATRSSGSNLTYLWNLGDGNVAAGESVIHTYAAVGSYQVVVTGTNSSGYAVAQEVVQVVEAPITGLSLSSDSPTPLGSATNFTATITSGTNITGSWDFGDGILVPGSNTASHQYLQAGIYFVKVTVSNAISSQTVEIQVTVFEAEHKIFLPVAVR
jgi:PKD repeat protein